MIGAAKRKQAVFAERLEEFQGAALSEAVLQARLDAVDENLLTLDLARAALPAPVAELPGDGGGAVGAVSKAGAKRAREEAVAVAEVDPGIFVRAGRRKPEAE
jgi:hypothetical protein